MLVAQPDFVVNVDRGRRRSAGKCVITITNAGNFRHALTPSRPSPPAPNHFAAGARPACCPASSLCCQSSSASTCRVHLTLAAAPVRRRNGVCRSSRNGNGGDGLGAFYDEDLYSSELPCPVEAKRVVLVRHGQSEWNSVGRIQGSSDVSGLTAKGRVQAETSRAMLHGEPFDALFRSPLMRARQTAEIIWADRVGPVTVLDDLREIDLHSFEGLIKKEGQARYGAAYRCWQMEPSMFELDGHFPVRELWARAADCWARILAADGQYVLVVAHNAVNQALVCTAIGLGPRHFRRLVQSNCGCSVLDFSPKTGGLDASEPCVTIRRLNQTPAVVHVPDSPTTAADGEPTPEPAACVILVCAVETHAAAAGRLDGGSSSGLPSARGRDQATRTGALLAALPATVMACSPAASARYTAAAIVESMTASSATHGLMVEPWELLKPVDMGEWAGRDWAQLVSEHPRQAAAWRQEPSAFDVPHAESLASVFGRAAAAWSDALAKACTLIDAIDCVLHLR